MRREWARHHYIVFLSVALFSVIHLLAIDAIAQRGQVHIYNDSPTSPGKGIKPDSQPPVAGAHVYFFAVGLAGANTGGVSMLSGNGVSYDSNGNGYLTTDSTGSFAFGGLYTCPTPDSQVYLLASGGSAGGGNNSYLAEISVLPVTCSNVSSVAFVTLNEPTTVAAAFALGTFADSYGDGFSTTPASAQSLADAVAYANTLVNSYTGQPASGTTLLDINTMADVLGACVNTSGGTTCQELMSYTTVSGQIPPADTWQAALSMAMNPSNQTQQLYDLLTSVVPYSPTLFSAPNSWQLSIAGAPTVQTLSTQSVNWGDPLTITGTNFGTDPNAIEVVIGGVLATVQSVSNTTIVTAIPSGASGDSVQVYVGSSGSNPVPLKITLPLKSFTVALNPLVSTYGTSVNITVTASSGLTIPPTGTVTCTAPGVVIPQITLVSGNGNSTGSLGVAGISVGPMQPVSCSYNGSATFAASKTPVIAYEEVIVSEISVTITTASSENPSVYGDVVTLSANLVPQTSSPYTPSGTVTFFDSNSTIGQVQLPSTGISISSAALSVGAHSITASYSGDVNFNSATSAVLVQTVSAQQVSCPSAQ